VAPSWAPSTVVCAAAEPTSRMRIQNK